MCVWCLGCFFFLGGGGGDYNCIDYNETMLRSGRWKFLGGWWGAEGGGLKKRVCGCLCLCMHQCACLSTCLRACLYTCVCVCVHARVCVCMNNAANQMIFLALTSHRTLPQPGRFHSDRSTAPSPVTSPQVCDKPCLKPVRIPVKLTAMIHGLKLQHFRKYQLKVSILYCTKTWKVPFDGAKN